MGTIHVPADLAHRSFADIWGIPKFDGDYLKSISVLVEMF